MAPIEVSNGATVKENEQRAGNRTSSPAPRKAEPKIDSKAPKTADSKVQDEKPPKKTNVLRMATLVLCMVFVLSLTIHVFLGISFLSNLGVPFAGALKGYSKLGVCVVGILLVATALTAKRSHANWSKKAS